jgi:arsenite methyltransferase
MSKLEFDEDVARQLEVIYGSRDVVRRRRLVREALAAQPGERILDVGCGPGFYVAELLEEVGANGSLVGIDAAAPMLALAANRCEGHANVEFHEGDATELPVGDGDFDAALSVQVFEYLDDVPQALGELRRALKPGGRVVLWDVDWSTVSMYSADPDRMRRVLDAWDAHLSDPVLPRTLAPKLREAGFEDVTCEGHTFATIDFIPDAYGAAFVPLILQYVKDQGTIPDAELDAWGKEQGELAERGEFYFACVQFCFTATAAPSAGGPR